MEYDGYLDEGRNGGEHGDGAESRDEHDGLRARSEQALGEIAQALIDNPTLHNAISAAFGAREKAIEAQHAAFQALNLPSAGDIERLERRVRSFSQRLEEVEEQLDDANREVNMLRRQLAKQAAEAEAASGPAKAPKPAKTAKSEKKAPKKAES